MYLFANVPAIAKAAGTTTNKDGVKMYVAHVLVEGAHKRSDAIALGCTQERTRSANCAWVAPASKAEDGYYKRHFSDKSKRDAWVKRVNDAHKSAPAKAKADKPAKQAPKKDAPKDEVAVLLAQMVELNKALIAALAK